MSVAKIIEVSAQSEKSFDAAIRLEISKAKKTVSGIQGAWVNEQKIIVDDGEITGFRVNLRITFALNE